MVAALGDALRRRRRRADQHALQGHRGGLPAAEQRRARARSPSAASSAPTTSQLLRESGERTPAPPAHRRPAPRRDARGHALLRRLHGLGSERLGRGCAGTRRRREARRSRGHPLHAAARPASRKGAMCTHAQNLRAFRAWTHVDRPARGRSLPHRDALLPQLRLQVRLARGDDARRGSLPEAVFDAGRCLERISKDRVSVFPGPPAIYQSLLMREDLATLRPQSSLRLAVTGAAVMPVELVERMRDTLHIADGHHRLRPDRDHRRRHHVPLRRSIRSPSRRRRDARFRASRSASSTRNGKNVAPNEPGEVWVRGYNVMKGYFHAPEETAKTIDADGFLHTGDVGVMNERGYIRITDRMKDMFIVGGFNAYPAEIENVMLAQGDLAEVAVVGVPDERLGEVGMAFVVLKKGKTDRPRSIDRVVSRQHRELQGAAPRRGPRGASAQRERQGARSSSSERARARSDFPAASRSSSAAAAASAAASERLAERQRRRHHLLRQRRAGRRRRRPSAARSVARRRRTAFRLDDANDVASLLCQATRARARPRPHDRARGRLQDHAALHRRDRSRRMASRARRGRQRLRPRLQAAMLAHFRQGGGGSFVFVSTAGLDRFPPGDILSIGRRARSRRSLRGIASEEGRFDIRANVVALGVFDAGHLPGPRRERRVRRSVGRRGEEERRVAPLRQARRGRGGRRIPRVESRELRDRTATDAGRRIQPLMAAPGRADPRLTSAGRPVPVALLPGTVRPLRARSRLDPTGRRHPVT